MSNQVYTVTGNKISSLIIDENSLKFSSQQFSTKEEFQNAWVKKLSLATKVEIKYDSIKSIKKEDNDKNILIKYKAWSGIPTDCEFAFSNPEDYEVFFNFIVKERYFVRTQETLTPFKAVRNYAIGLVAVIAFTIFSYYQAIEIQDGTVEETGSRKTRMFNFLIGHLGDKGVIAIGSLIIFYLLYQIWSRYSNPPNQLKFLPPNG